MPALAADVLSSLRNSSSGRIFQIGAPGCGTTSQSSSHQTKVVVIFMLVPGMDVRCLGVEGPTNDDKANPQRRQSNQREKISEETTTFQVMMNSHELHFSSM